MRDIVDALYSYAHGNWVPTRWAAGPTVDYQLDGNVGRTTGITAVLLQNRLRAMHPSRSRRRPGSCCGVHVTARSRLCRRRSGLVSFLSHQSNLQHLVAFAVVITRVCFFRRPCRWQGVSHRRMGLDPCSPNSRIKQLVSSLKGSLRLVRCARCLRLLSSSACLACRLEGKCWLWMVDMILPWAHARPRRIETYPGAP